MRHTLLRAIVLHKRASFLDEFFQAYFSTFSGSAFGGFLACTCSFGFCWLLGLACFGLWPLLLDFGFLASGFR